MVETCGWAARDSTDFAIIETDGSLTRLPRYAGQQHLQDHREDFRVEVKEVEAVRLLKEKKRNEESRERERKKNNGKTRAKI